jgi:spore coat polysaccharide biosynthesis protein SpsF (cytidylyltransferase family)
MKAVCIIQARLNSTRLPRKVLLPLNGGTVLGEVIQRCGRISGIDQVVCAVPASDYDELKQDGAHFIPGPEHDVLARYYKAALTVNAGIVMRITADCPLLCPELCASVLSTLKRENVDYASNIEPRTFPKGMDCEVFTRDLLNAAHESAGPEQREHVTTWMRAAPIKRLNVSSPWPLEGRLTLDTWDDYQTIKASFEHH